MEDERHQRWWGPPLGVPRPGSAKGRYCLLEELDSSARTQVYLARDHLLRRMVVIKVFAHAGALLEARATIRARHPRVIEVHDAGFHGGRGYIVFEYCEGGTLLDWSRGRAWSEIVARVLEVGAALSHCHRCLLVHGDVKPTNVLIHRGAAMLADFGVAGPPDLVEVFAGTPGYIAPELVEGRRSPSNDVFGLACTAWVCLFESRPHAGASASALLVAAEDGAVEWPTKRPSSMPVELVPVLARGLEPSQEHRPPLSQWLEELRAVVTRPRWRRTWRACRSWQTWLEQQRRSVG